MVFKNGNLLRIPHDFLLLPSLETNTILKEVNYIDKFFKIVVRVCERERI